MPKDERPAELLDWSQELKRQDRKKLSEIDPAAAQALAESVFNPKFARIADGEALDWPGDLGEDWEPESE